VSNWAGNVAFSAQRVLSPTSVEELSEAIRGASRIRALGAGHSFSPAGDTTGDLVRLSALPPTVLVAPDRASVEVPAGLAYTDVAATVHSSGLALANLASLPNITVGGACATGTHGSGSGLFSLAGNVRAVRFVAGDGSIVRLTRADDRDTFPGAVVALGALGIVASLTLEVEPSFDVAQVVRLEVPLSSVAENFDEVFAAAYSVSVFTDYASGTARIWLKHRLPHDSSDPGADPDRGALAERSGWIGGRAATQPEHPVPGMHPSGCTDQLGAPGPWHERLPHFRPENTAATGSELQSEFFVGRSVAPAAIAALADIAEEIAAVLLIAEIRTVRADDLWLSGAYGRDTAALHFTWIGDSALVLPVVEQVEKRLMPLGARPHWGKVTTVDPAKLLALYPRGAEFAALARRFDPDLKFRNTFFDRLFA
jgi:xylitol oxidase